MGDSNTPNLKPVPTKQVVTAIKPAKNLTPSEIISICNAFSISQKGNNKLKATELLVLLQSSTKIRSIIDSFCSGNKSMMDNIKTDDIFYCFNEANEFVCTQFDLKSCKHSIITPNIVGKVSDIVGKGSDIVGNL